MDSKIPVILDEFTGLCEFEGKVTETVAEVCLCAWTDTCGTSSVVGNLIRSKWSPGNEL
jgi:hypothetical protein